MAARKDPYPNFNFVVDIGSDAISFAEVELPAAEIDVIEYREGADRVSFSRKLPGRVRYGNVVLRRGVDGQLTLWQWFEAVSGGQLERRDVTISLLNARQEPVRRWLLRNAWPAKYATSDLNAKGNDVVIELLELAVESIDLLE